MHGDSIYFFMSEDAAQFPKINIHFYPNTKQIAFLDCINCIKILIFYVRVHT